MNRIVVAIISDTHGILRKEAISSIMGCDFIIHAGDVGSPEVIEELKFMAKVLAVRGNVDREEWANLLPSSETVSIGDKKIHVLHDIKMLDVKPEDLGIHVVISGHSHKPSEEIKGGVIYLNPGSIGPRRFKLPIAMAKLIIEDSKISTSFIYL